MLEWFRRTRLWELRESERIVLGNAKLFRRRHLIVGLTRVRNESLLLQDTLDHVSRHADAIVAYDDASSDATPDILLAHPRVAAIVRNSRWEPRMEDRLLAETRHRGLLLELARSRLRFDWALCFDADERCIGDLHGFARQSRHSRTDGVRIQLFDAYMTPDDHAPYSAGQPLLDFRKFFGPERRDIVMMWRNTGKAHFAGLDQREPRGIEAIETAFHCQHYGKSLSIEHWEQTCDYYVTHFPYETYGQKWQARKGMAIHTASDFGRPLLPWGPALFAASTKIN